MIVWDKPPISLGVVAEGLEPKVRSGLASLGQRWAGRLESEARQNAPWADRTGAARAGLTGASETTGDGVEIVLAHTVEYGIYLELGTYKMSPRPVIVPTLEAAYAAVMADARALLRSL